MYVLFTRKVPKALRGFTYPKDSVVNLFSSRPRRTDKRLSRFISTITMWLYPREKSRMCQADLVVFSFLNSKIDFHDIWPRKSIFKKSLNFWNLFLSQKGFKLPKMLLEHLKTLGLCPKPLKTVGFAHTYQPLKRLDLNFVSASPSFFTLSTKMKLIKKFIFAYIRGERIRKR